MNMCPVCGLTYDGTQQFCVKCGARLYPKERPRIVEWLSPTSFIDY
ncbi:MAG: hypothetical protein HYS62_00740 [Candidatus Aenigmarchaeota archaeon]|nr:hypothetical protein [Candidatus Aenigmarchaeota archaeon]